MHVAGATLIGLLGIRGGLALYRRRK
jgi:hypothetical protein